MEGLAAEGSTGGPQDCPPGPEPLKFPPCLSPCPEVWAPLLKSSAMLKKYPSGRHQAGWLGSRRCHWVTTGSCGLFLHQEEGGNYSCPVLCGVSESELPVKDHPAWPWAGHPGQDCGGTGFLHSMPPSSLPGPRPTRHPAPCHSHPLDLRSGEHEATPSGYGKVIGHGQGRQNTPLWTGACPAGSPQLDLRE